MKKLYYVFKVEVLSCKGDGSWVDRTTVYQSNTCKDSFYTLAGNIAVRHLRPEERGVRVTFLGLTEDTTKGGKKPQSGEIEITILNPFTLELKKTSTAI